MSDLLAEIRALISAGKVRISAHGFDELADDDISLTELLNSIEQARWVEEYQDYHKGPCVLVLQILPGDTPVHALWGIAKNSPGEATLITAYRPDPKRWTADFLRRTPK
jgi:hypothetical protein